MNYALNLSLYVILHTNISFHLCYSGDLLDVVLWSERATSFPAEEIHGNGQTSPQIVIFVGTLVRSFGGTSLSGGSSCKWYINPEVPEVKRLMARYLQTYVTAFSIYIYLDQFPTFLKLAACICCTFLCL